MEYGADIGEQISMLKMVMRTARVCGPKSMMDEGTNGLGNDDPRLRRLEHPRHERSLNGPFGF